MRQCTPGDIVDGSTPCTARYQMSVRARGLAGTSVCRVRCWRTSIIGERCLWLLGTLAWLNGCTTFGNAAAHGEPVSVDVLTSAIQCGVESSQPAIEWVDDPGRLAEIIRRSVGTRAVPEVDFGTHGVLVVSMGQRPSAGYSLTLIEASARVDGNILEVGVQRAEPPPGMMTAQVITRPCLLLKVPAVPFKRIRVLDQDRRVWVSGTRSCPKWQM